MSQAKIIGFLLLLLAGGSLFAQKPKPGNWKKIRVLVYTKNGIGYVHENIPYAAASVMDLGKKHGFTVDTSSNPALFTRENLDRYNFLVFTSTNNDVFATEEQRLAFRHFIEAGGGLVGIHSAIATERNWKWYKQLTGATFAWHAAFQKIRVRVLDHAHPSVQGLPLVWERADECYFQKELYPGTHTILMHEVGSLQPDERIQQYAGPYKDFYPAAWHHFFDGGVVWMTTLGHDKKDYSDPVFMQHIFQGMAYVAGFCSKKKDYGKAYAKDRNEEARF
jgi:uncharacterized protein